MEKKDKNKKKRSQVKFTMFYFQIIAVEWTHFFAI